MIIILAVTNDLDLSTPMSSRHLIVLLLSHGWFSEKVYQGGDRVRVCITHLLSIKKINIGDFNVSVAINI